jgi:hypothetical protein
LPPPASCCCCCCCCCSGIRRLWACGSVPQTLMTGSLSSDSLIFNTVKRFFCNFGSQCQDSRE